MHDPRLSLSGGQPLPLKLSLSLSRSLSMHDPILSLSPSLSMHELSLSMPEPMLSLSMLILATYPEAALDVTLRTHRQKMCFVPARWISTIAQ